MSSVNSVRIPGLATGMDTDQMIKEMITGEQSKVDKAEQKKQTTKWQQESYRDIIKNVKGLYDKYFSATSPDYILSSKVFSTTTINSSNSSVISATAGAGANKIDYKLQVNKIATPPKLESIKIAKDQTMETYISSDPSTITINGKTITINKTDTIKAVVDNINQAFPDREVKAVYSEMTGKFSIEGAKTGLSSKLSFSGELFDGGLFSGIGLTEKSGTNNEVIVYANDGTTVLNTINEESNSFTIDNITYNVNGVSTEKVSMLSTKDTKQTVEKTKAFIDEYNKMIDGIYDSVTKKKNRDYPPLTETQRKDMSEEEIENWEKKAKEGILRNDKELRAFMDDIKSALNSQIGDSKMTLRDMGISSDNDYNKSGQLCVDVDKFTKTLEENPDLAYKVTVGGFEKLKDVTYKYAGSSAGLFVKKAGMEKSSTEINNLFSSQIKTQEEQIKSLTRKMKDKEGDLYKKFARLESNMNKLNSQMSYLTSSMGM